MTTQQKRILRRQVDEINDAIATRNLYHPKHGRVFWAEICGDYIRVHRLSDEMTIPYADGEYRDGYGLPWHLGLHS